MTISEIQLKTLTNKPPKFKNLIYPLPKNPDIQKPYYVCIAAGQRGSGKSFAIVRCIKNIEETGGFFDPETGNDVPMRTVIFSPTINSNPIFNSLKSLDEDDIINEYSHEKLAELLAELKADKEKTQDYKDYIVAYNKYIKMTPKQFLNWGDEKAIDLLYSQDFIDPKELEKPPHPYGRVVNIILDDCLASNAFSSKKGNTLLKSVLNGRHYSINIFIAAQNLKSVNKAIRGNTELFMLFKFCSMRIILDDLYEEISGMVTQEQFIELYTHATEDDHDCLVIDKKAEKGKQFKKNLDVVLSFNNEMDNKKSNDKIDKTLKINGKSY